VLQAVKPWSVQPATAILEPGQGDAAVLRVKAFEYRAHERDDAHSQLLVCLLVRRGHVQGMLAG
jgi:hypothetical protein